MSLQALFKAREIAPPDIAQSILPNVRVTFLRVTVPDGTDGDSR